MNITMAEAKLNHLVSQPDEERVEDNALMAFDYNLRFPIPRYKATCRRCSNTDKPEDDLQLSRFHSKKNPQKQFPFWMDQMMKCTQCSCVEAFGQIPMSKKEHLNVIEDYNTYVVEWRQVLEANKESLESLE